MSGREYWSEFHHDYAKNVSGPLRYPLRISLCDSTRPIHSSPRRLVVGGLSSVTQQQIDQVEEIFRLHPNFARARCVQLLGHMVRSILEHADENNSMKTLCQKHQPAIICINGNWPPFPPGFWGLSRWLSLNRAGRLIKETSPSNVSAYYAEVQFDPPI